MVIFNLLHLLKEHRKNRETVSDPTQPIFVLTKSLLDDIVQSSDPLLSLGISLGLRAEWWAVGTRASNEDFTITEKAPNRASQTACPS